MSSALAEEGIALVEAARTKGAALRLFGGVAVELLVPDSPLKRPPPGDVDCVIVLRDLVQVREVFRERGYRENQEILRRFGFRRRLFYHLERSLKVDLCIDFLEFSRRIDLRLRLGSRALTVSVADLLLSKLQARDFTDKDEIDTVNLLERFRPGLSEGSAEFSEMSFTEPCARDWGLFQLVEHNLLQVEARALGETLASAASRVQALRNAMRTKAKTITWKLRSIVGSRVNYWNDFSEEETGF